MSAWGLATLGGLLLGGAACTPARADQPPPGEPPMVRVEAPIDSQATGPSDKKGSKKASEKARKAAPKDRSAAAGHATTHDATDATIRHDKPRTMGKMMGKMAMPRTEEATPGEPQAGTPPKPAPAPEPRRDGGVWVPQQPPRTGGVPMPQRIEPPAKTPSKTDDTEKVPSAKSTKQKTHDGASKDATSTPPKTKPERTP